MSLVEGIPRGMVGPPTVDRLGTGWAFPARPDVDRGALVWQTGPALVRQSILIILDTEPGERVMRPEFGCGLRRFIMEPNNPTTRAAIAREVEGSLRLWERRITVRTVDVRPSDDPATVIVAVDYAHVRDLSPSRLELPFVLATSGAGGRS